MSYYQLPNPECGSHPGGDFQTDLDTVLAGGRVRAFGRSEIDMESGLDE